MPDFEDAEPACCSPCLYTEKEEPVVRLKAGETKQASGGGGWCKSVYGEENLAKQEGHLQSFKKWLS